MHYRTGPQAKVTTVEEFLKRGGGSGGGDPPPEPSGIEKKIRSWAEELIRREERALEDAGKAVPRVYVENRHRVKSLSEQFQKISTPGFEGTVEAVKVLWSYGFGLRTVQPS